MHIDNRQRPSQPCPCCGQSPWRRRSSRRGDRVTVTDDVCPRVVLLPETSADVANGAALQVQAAIAAFAPLERRGDGRAGDRSHGGSRSNTRRPAWSDRSRCDRIGCGGMQAWLARYTARPRQRQPRSGSRRSSSTQRLAGGRSCGSGRPPGHPASAGRGGTVPRRNPASGGRGARSPPSPRTPAAARARRTPTAARSTRPGNRPSKGTSSGSCRRGSCPAGNVA